MEKLINYINKMITNKFKDGNKVKKLILLSIFGFSISTIDKPKLYDFAFSKYSQDGEEGIIKKYLK